MTLTNKQKEIIKNCIVYILSALLGLLTSCTISLNIQKNNTNSNQNNSIKTNGTNKMDSTTVNIKPLETL